MSAIHRQTSADTACAYQLERVERVFAEHGLTCSEEDHARARDLAVEVFAGFNDEREALAAARVALAEGLFGAHAAALAATPARADALAERLRPVLGLSREALARQLLSCLDTAGRAPAETVTTLLGLLIGLTPVSGASLWRQDRAGSAHCIDDAGVGARSAGARTLARRLLQGEDALARPRAELFALSVREQGQGVAVLVARAEPRRRATAQVALRVVLAPLAAALAFDRLMARNASDERALVEGGERRLVRLGFDLHDGPLQELLLLSEDLRLFREQLVSVLGVKGRQALLRGRLDDLDARLVALEGGLRRISTSLHASVQIDRPFAQALDELLEAFASRCRVVPRLSLDGDAEAISPSQRIALLSVVGEALNNVREHAATATEVRVAIEFGPAGVTVEVVDDGRGFDVEAALLRAARRGRMGLAGIHERVRLLGGHCVVDSGPGGPTSVSLSLPRWEPLTAATPNRRRTDRLRSTG
jgi:signal transduction histidine kinase